MNLAKVKKLNIPKVPGSYQFFNKRGKIIYVGKAVDLRSRVLSYWRDSAGHTPAKYAMMKQIESIKWIEVDTEIEALLLEANLIKKYQPEFNVTLRDDKRFVYIKISTEDKYPRIFMTRSITRAGKFFGPFTSTEAVRETLKILRKIWPFRTCRTMPKKACLYYRINKCPGCCEEKISIKDYQKIVKQIILFLEGKKKQVVRLIEREAKSLIKDLKLKDDLDKESKLNFLKFQLVNLNKVLEHSRIISLSDKYAADVVELAKILNLEKVPERIEGYDISNIYGQEAVGSMVVFQGGEPEKSEYRKFKIKNPELEGDVWMLREVLNRRFKRISPNEGGSRVLGISRLQSWPKPDLIIIDGGKAQLNTVLRVMKKYKLNIPAISVSKGKGLRSAQAPDKIFFPGEKKALELPLASPALHIIKRVRDEAHRFAISFHRKLKRKRVFN